MYDNKFVNIKEKEINRILAVLEKTKISTDNHLSHQMPFFMTSPNNKNFDIGFKELNPNIPEKLNRNIKLIYQLLGNDNAEIYIGEWIIMNVSEALNIYKDYCSDNQNKVFDIAYRHLGLGYVQVVACDLESELLFYREDGGSNGWDRTINYQNLIKNGSAGSNKFTFDEWFFNIKYI